MHSSRLASMVTLCLSLTACPFPFPFFNDDEGGDGPCDSDVLGCENNIDEFMLDPSCTLEGDLELVLGQGENEFSPLGPDEVPMVNYGFQGGTHIWTAVQVQNPALDYPLLEIEITVSACSASDCTDPNNWTVDTTRQLVANQNTMTTTSEGWFEQVKMLVIVDAYAYAEMGRVEMRVTDPCNRQGSVVAEGKPAG